MGSWIRLWSVLATEHQFLGSKLYVPLIHMLIGAVIWTTGIHEGSLALMGYGNIVLFDAIDLLIDAVPLLLEYSHNARPSLQFPFGLQPLTILLRFTNSIVLIYRSVQGFKEGLEHLMTHSHHGQESFTVSVSPHKEFETYEIDHANINIRLCFLCVVAALTVSTYSSLYQEMHVALWKLRATPAHGSSTLHNPYNRYSLLSGILMLVMILIGTSTSLKQIEPWCCVAVALIMGQIGIPSATGLGKMLLHGIVSPSAEDGYQDLIRHVSRVPGVVVCTRSHVWSVDDATHRMLLRIAIDPRIFSSSDHRLQTAKQQISNIIKSMGNIDYTVEITATNND